MKLHTSIPPRRDGTVKVTGQDRQTYVFEADADGELACDVTDKASLAWMLGTDNFYPADPADAEAAMALVKPLMADDESDADDDGDEQDDVPAALPIEANTPPVRRKPGPKPKAK